MSSSLTSIGNYAFWSCSDLTSITLPSSLTSIGSSAFYNCYALAEVYNYSSLTLAIESTDNGSVAEYAKVVYNASDLTGEKPATRIQIIDNVKYYVYEDDFIALVPTSRDITSINLDSRTTEINQYAFYDCASLTSADLSGCTSLTSIEDSAFCNCRGLTSITLPDSLTSIGDDAFEYCVGLTSITLLSSLTSIGTYAFQYCSGLTEVIIDSEYVYNKATSTSACGSLFNNSSITTVKVLSSLDDGTNSYITTNFTKGENEVIGGKSYTVYSK